MSPRQVSLSYLSLPRQRGEPLGQPRPWRLNTPLAQGGKLVQPGLVFQGRLLCSSGRGGGTGVP